MGGRSSIVEYFWPFYCGNSTGKTPNLYPNCNVDFDCDTDHDRHANRDNDSNRDSNTNEYVYCHKNSDRYTHKN